MMDKTINNPPKDAASNDAKCLWMAAGVVSYKLCDLEFECENCTYDKIIRSKIPTETMRRSIKTSSGEQVMNYIDQAKMLIDKLVDSQINPKYYYSKNHICFCKDDDGTVLIGIDNLLAKMLNYVASVVLLPVGHLIKQHKSFCWLIQKNQTLTLYSPISGMIVQTNPLLSNSPDYIRTTDLKISWLVKVKLNEDTKLQDFYTGQKAQAWFHKELKRTKDTFYEIIGKHRPLKSPTQFDGGIFSTSLSEIIPNDEYWKFLRTLCFF